MSFKIKKMIKRRGKSRLSTIPNDHLMYIVREWIFSNGSFRGPVTKICIHVNNDEAKWILDIIPNLSENARERYKQLSECDNVYYNARAFHSLGQKYKACELFCAAGEIGMEFLALRTFNTANEYINAFNHGNILIDLTQFEARLGKVKCARSIGLQLLFIYLPTASQKMFIHDNRFNPSVKYAIGRELEGYKEFWDPGKQPFCHEYIDFYLRIRNAERMTAIYTILVLRRLIHKDVAVMIAKINEPPAQA